MSTAVPLNFRASPIPAGWEGTPQEFLDLLVARLSAETTNTIAFFASGSVAPTSNIGPWLKNGTEWYVWDNGTAAYIPITVSSQSLRYIASQSAPDPTLYTFWIALDGSGAPTAIKYYYSGSWVDIYAGQFANYSTTTAMNAAIAAAIAGATGSPSPAKAHEAAPQTLAVDGSVYQIIADTVDFDPNSVYNAASSAYIAPATGYYAVYGEAQIDNAGADASTMEFAVSIGINPSPPAANAVGTGLSIASPPGSRWYPQVSGIIQATIGDAIRFYMSANTTGLVGNVNVSNVGFMVYKIQ